MMLAVFLFLLLLTGGSTSNYTEPPELLDDQQNFNQSFEESGSTSNYTELTVLPDDQLNVKNTDSSKCSYQAVLDHLTLTQQKYLYTRARPVKNHTETTTVWLQILLYSVLDVREIDQTFIPYVWIYMDWMNDYIRWDPKEFCGIESVSVPIEDLWKPDITIEEMTEKDKAPPSPYLIVRHFGEVVRLNDMVLVNTCKMQIYKFPFNIQSCNITFKAVVHNDKEIRLVHYEYHEKKLMWKSELPSQYEWLIINMTYHEKTVDTLGFNQSMVVYTISMKRQSLLYVVNFMLPVLFFLCLDLASFLISDRGGEKLSFKVTVLLAVTVLQLILNEILPASSNRIPLIATYCIGSFGLMMLSLLETILVMHLMEKDSASDDSEADRDQSQNEKKWTHCGSVCDVSTGETLSGLLSVAKEDSSSKLTEESHALEKVSNDLREVEKTLTVLLNSRKEEGKPGCWTRVAKRINKVFLIFYVIVAGLFLAYIFLTWYYAVDE